MAEKTKLLLQKYHISPKQHLGQNFIVTPSVFCQMITYASLAPTDRVLDIGAGLGFLTRFLAQKCKKVLAVELDPQLVKVLRDQLNDFTNVEIISGDVIKKKMPPFHKIVSAPPYYLSSSLISWLFTKNFDCAVLILQKEFVNRLTASIGSDNYGWLTVITRYNAEVETLEKVPPHVFYPQPQVDSLLIRLTPKKFSSFPLIEQSMFTDFLKTLFTHRNRKVRNGILPYVNSKGIASKKDVDDLVDSLPFHDQRIRKLSPKDFGELANALLE